MRRDRPAVRARPLTRAGLAIVRVAQDVARLVVPVECPGCHRWDVLLCGDCAAVLTGPATRCEWDVPRLDRMDGRTPLPVWRVTRYAGPVRGVVLAWKDGGRADLTPTLVAAVRQAALGLGPVLGAATTAEALRVVPVPSSAAARRRRGAHLVQLLAEGAAEGLRGAGVPAEVAPVLSVRRGRRDQVGLGARARGRNTSGSVRLARRAGRVTEWAAPHLLVDDVVTTGSTLVACDDALAAVGGLVLGALVLAATPPPS